MKYLLLSSFLFFIFSCSNKPDVFDRKAFDDINFGISQNEYYSKIDTILSKFKDIGEYKIGKLRFTSVQPEFHADSLIKVTFQGAIYTGFSNFYEDYNSIVSSLSEKYGDPPVVFNDPSKITSDRTGKFLAMSWSEGPKGIEMRFCKYPDDGYSVLLTIEDTFAKYAIQSEEIGLRAKESNKIKEVL